ncbi:MAG: Gfo/Idh/MocA family oxidoreductase [Candidatus Hydrogenedentes bacterium]|nr:Gfo/Idh/MocA family oxidoreductase [Candidatus Hydrogenedentota bacterium]
MNGESINRRSFLGSAAASVAVIAAAQSAAEPAPERRIKVAVITHAGGAHLGAYFNALAQTAEAESVVLADPDGNAESGARAALGEKLTRVYQDWNELLSAEKPTMALISVEARLGPEAIDAALDAGCHVFAEKPACVNAEDFARLADKADAKGLHLMLALANRLNPDVQEAKRAVAEDRIGKVYGVDLRLIEDQTRLTRPEYQQSWFADKARAGGGHLAWLGIHWLDLAMYITGASIGQVAGFTGNVGGQPINIEDAVAMSLRFDNGAVGTLTSGYYRDKGSESEIKIWGSKGWLLLASDAPNTMRLYSNASGISDVSGTPESDAYTTFVRAAVRASAGLQVPPITARESLRAVKTVYRAYAAAESGMTVRVE